jgi:hypothetical protein
MDFLPFSLVGQNKKLKTQLSFVDLIVSLDRQCKENMAIVADHFPLVDVYTMSIDISSIMPNHCFNNEAKVKLYQMLYPQEKQLV